MANEVYVSAQGDTLATHILAQELEMLLHQRPFMRQLCRPIRLSPMRPTP
jgi:hypothetical protein